MEGFPPQAESASFTGPALMSRRFRQFLPVVIDVETGGFNCVTDALLEIAAVMIEFAPDGRLRRGASHSYHVRPFEGANLEPASLAVNGIDPFHPLRPALPEKDALGRIFTEVRTAMKTQDCRRAVLVGHNAAFDLGFLNAAVTRAEIKRNPFHPFSCFDTATLAGAAFGQTVLAKAVAGLRHILGFERGAFGKVRRRTNRRHFLRSLQRARRRVAQGGCACAGAVGRRAG